MPLILITSCLLLGCDEDASSETRQPYMADQAVLSAPQVDPADRRTEPLPADDDAPTEFTELASGLRYRILRKTDGKVPNAGGYVRVYYEGKLDDGSVFDSSYERGAPDGFGLSQVIKGWTEGLQLIGEGGMIELEVPPHLGYGKAGHDPGIPPNATLHFIVEVIDVQ